MVIAVRQPGARPPVREVKPARPDPRALLEAWLVAHELSRAAFADLLGCGKASVTEWFARAGKRRCHRPHPVYRERIEQITKGAVPATAWATPAELRAARATVALDEITRKIRKHGPPLKARNALPNWKERDVYNAYLRLGRMPPAPLRKRFETAPGAARVR